MIRQTFAFSGRQGPDRSFNFSNDAHYGVKLDHLVGTVKCFLGD